VKVGKELDTVYKKYCQEKFTRGCTIMAPMIMETIRAVSASSKLIVFANTGVAIKIYF
jgi:hypothetical protein